MSSEASVMTEKQYKKERVQRKISEIKNTIYMLFHMIFWRFLWSTRLARPYSRWACRHNLYSKFADGRCQWCGNNHDR